jgi:uncharacterized protein YjbI with pentapeptide repeats
MKPDHPIRIEHDQQRIEASDANLAGSTFTGVNLAGSTFNDVNLSASTITDANLSACSIANANLSRLTITDTDLSHASIVDSLTQGMTINGIPVSAMLTAYKAAHPGNS